MGEPSSYQIELQCNHPEWWCYNVVITAHGVNRDGSVAGYHAVEDKIAPIDGGDHPRPADYPTPRTTRLQCGPCEGIDLYLYILPHRLPDENSIEHTPLFEAELRILKGKSCLHTQQVAVNPWGGASLHIRWPEK